MNHKRKGPKSTRGGCLLCKPHKDQRLKDTLGAQTPQERRSRIGMKEFLLALLLPSLAFAVPKNYTVTVDGNACTCRAAPTPTPKPTIAPTVAPTPTPPPVVAVPELARWESQMVSFGRTHCEFLKGSAGSFDEKLAGTYYDSLKIFNLIHDYTRDPYWLTCTEAARSVYRDQYVVPNSGYVPGYWNFSRGLLLDFQRTGSTTSKLAAIDLSKNAAFARDSTPEDTTQIAYSREVAYAIKSYLNAEALGEPRRTRLTKLVTDAFGHLTKYRAGTQKPFFQALTALALIQYHEANPDSRTIPALIATADALWSRCWRADAEAFLYIERPTAGEDPAEPAPDLNLLIAPAYGWLWKTTGEVRFQQRHDAIFAGGVKRSYLYAAKIWNQNYTYSVEGLAWRKGR